MLGAPMPRAAEPPAEVAHVALPPGGSGPLLVMVSGRDGAATHRSQADAYAREGFVVVLHDVNRLDERRPEALRAAIGQALARPEVRSSKAVVVGYSAGGLAVLAHANRMPQSVAAVVAYYPSTWTIGDFRSFLTEPRVAVPTLVLAGVADTYTNCCTIERARELARLAAAPDVAAPIELVEYPGADHGFVLPAYPQVHRPDDAADAVRRSIAFARRAGIAPAQ